MASKMRNAPDEFKSANTKSLRASEDDVEGHGMGTRNAPEEPLGNIKSPRASEDDVEGHGKGMRNAPDEFKSANAKSLKATEGDDTEGHWMPDAGSSMRLAKARNSEIEREARQHQLANDARQNRLEHDPKRTHQKG